MLPDLYQVLRSASFVSSESLKAHLKQFSSDQGHSAGHIMALCRWALTGAMTVRIPLFSMCSTHVVKHNRAVVLLITLTLIYMQVVW